MLIDKSEKMNFQNENKQFRKKKLHKNLSEKFIVVSNNFSPNDNQYDFDTTFTNDNLSFGSDVTIPKTNGNMKFITKDNKSFSKDNALITNIKYQYGHQRPKGLKSIDDYIFDYNDNTVKNNSDIIGYGSFSVVKPCVELKTKRQCVVKIISKLDTSSIDNSLMHICDEIKILGHVQGHPNIVSLLGYYENFESIHIYMPRYKSDLSEYIGQFDDTNLEFPECFIFYLFEQIVAAVSYCHSRGVVHRDVKLENILVDYNRPPKLVLVDFGYSAIKLKSKDIKLKDHVGSIEYAAPELVMGKPNYSGKSADVWAIGVCLYILVTSEYPFWNANDRSVIAHMIKHNEVTFSTSITISNLLENLIYNILNKNALKRYTIDKIQKHKWFNMHKLYYRETKNKIKS